MSFKLCAEFRYRPVHTEFIDEEILVEAAKRGDKDAFADLFHLHSGRTYQCLLRILRNREDARDALQETFFKAFAYIKTFEGKAKFSTWLIRIAVNSALMAVRKKQRHALIQLDSGNGEPGLGILDPVDRRVDIHGVCEKAQLIGHLMSAIDRLKPSLREILKLHLGCDCSIEEVSVLTNLSPATIKSRLFRARRILRMALERQQILQQRSRAL